MRDPKSLTSVAEFHTTFQHPILSAPAIPSEARSQLRVALLAEELKELEAAIKDNNIVEVADALCDLQYVLSGAILEFGLQDKFAALFEEVQRSNMSKACKSQDEAEATMKYYFDKDGTESYFEEKDRLFLVYRKSDNKTLKSIAYSPADLQSILEA